MKKICIIIPAYNEQSSIDSVISSIKKVLIVAKIVVINDGSTDKTLQVLSRIKNSDLRFKNENKTLTIINLPFNLGIGGAVQTGLIYAKENGFDVAVQIDADGQHDASYLPKLLKNLDSKTDMVIGSRYVQKTKYQTPLLRLLGIKIFSVLIKVTCGKKVYDTTSGYRVFGKNAIDFFYENYPKEFPEPRSIVAFLKNGYRIKEVSVETRQRMAGNSSISFFYAIYLMLSISIAILFESFKKYDR